ncbi:helix-turn-helix domain-containing protein [Priestia filamentosa]|uniref:helix-turn-helix domain-containing protein n=1 Tax=Priestia filamentosa TaxID=1402861 RepID=UPI002E1BD5BE|nr:helix-turn-helix domain-containing protein [Priestia filamentosa]
MMTNTGLMLSYLERNSKNIPYQVWVRKPQGENQYVANDININSKVPPPSIPRNPTFTTFRQNQHVYLSFGYLEDYEVIIAIPEKFYVMKVEELEYLNLLYKLSYQQEIVQKKDLELENLIEGIRSITSSLDLDEVLKKIVTNTLKVIPAADRGFLQLYDPVIDRLIPKAFVGFNDRLQLFKVKVGESITGKVFEDGKPRIYYSEEEVYAAMDKYHISKKNNDHILSSTSPFNSIKSAMCVPVSIGENQLGVMIVHQRSREKKLTDHHLNLLNGFASQAAVAIQNAQLYSEVKIRLEEVTELSEKLKEKNQLLSKRNEVHGTLTKLSLQNKGAETIILELNRMIGKSLSYFNATENIWYPNQANRVPVFSSDEIEKIFLKRRTPVYVDVFTQKKESYYLYPIVNGAIFLGCFVVSVSEPFSPLDQITVEQGSAVLALELVKKLTMTELYYTKTHEFFNELLQNKNRETCLEKGKEFNLNLNSFLFVAIFEVTIYNDLQVLEMNIHRLVSRIKEKLQPFSILIYGFHNKVVLLVSLSNQSSLSAVTKQFDVTMKEWRANSGAPLRVGVGTLYKGIENVVKSYEEANLSLSYLKSRNKSELFFYEDIGVNRLFLQQPSDDIERFLNEVFVPLQTEHGEHNDLEKTLLSYIKNNKSAINTAKQLHIHINTLYQRLKKIEKQLNLSFDNPEDALKIQLACHLRETFFYSQI